MQEEELGFPRRRFPLSEYAYQALLTEADSAVNCEDSVRKKRLKLTPGMVTYPFFKYPLLFVYANDWEFSFN